MVLSERGKNDLCIEYECMQVRAYTAKNIFEDLKLAEVEFIQGSVCIHKETKLLLPKILYYFAKDMSLSMQGLLEIVIDSVSSEDEKKWMRNCIDRRLHKRIHWLPQSSTFRYFIHADLAAAATTQVNKDICVPMWKNDTACYFF